jgi:hypothetical protein
VIDTADGSFIDNIGLYKEFVAADILEGRIRFCSNLDLTDNWSVHIEALKQVMPSWMTCNTPNDLLSEVRRPIQGMTLPQLYIKVPGVWTGGHEENLRCFFNTQIDTNV